MRKLKEGKKYKITGVNPKSAWYSLRDNLIGQTILFLRDGTVKHQDYKLGRYETVGGLKILTGPSMGTDEHFICGFSARRIKEKNICTCGAYPFPHREGSGDCVADQGPFCGCCGEPCSWKTQRVGTGCNHRPVSSCCNCDVYMDVQMTTLANIDCDGDL